MKFKYFPDEITTALCEYANITDKETYDNCIGALFHLKVICENRYNAEYFRDMYRVLEKFVEVRENEIK